MIKLQGSYNEITFHPQRETTNGTYYNYPNMHCVFTEIDKYWFCRTRLCFDIFWCRSSYKLREIYGVLYLPITVKESIANKSSSHSSVIALYTLDIQSPQGSMLGILIVESFNHWITLDNQIVKSSYWNWISFNSHMYSATTRAISAKYHLGHCEFRLNYSFDPRQWKKSQELKLCKKYYIN